LIEKAQKFLGPELYKNLGTISKDGATSAIPANHEFYPELMEKFNNL
jgi:hypothetical protein